ncbi:hypothetical protein SLA2020_113440 [Shorea laevis]
MCFSRAHLLILVVMAASILGVSMANRDWTYNHNKTAGWGWGPWGSYHQPNRTDNSKKIIVGGSDNWHFGVNYTDWAFKNAPFYFNDTLVFKYDSPNVTFSHSVYLLPNLWSFINCDFSQAKMVANITEGRGNGFEFVLKQWRPHYFACGEGPNRFHCKNGNMKFFVMPLLRWP